MDDMQGDGNVIVSPLSNVSINQEPDATSTVSSKPPMVETQISSGGQSSSGQPKLSTGSYRARDRKIGHRRVDKTGEVTYKKKPTSELMAAVQLGIGQSIGHLTAKPERDLLMQDFYVVDSVFFPSEGSNLTPAHHLTDFRFKTYAPLAFRYFRELFQIQPDDFMLSLCNDSLRALSNPGASGSIFYMSADDEFIIKTVQHKEADFLQKLLPGYYMNLNQNPRTTLPKFYGLFCYQCGGKNIRFVVMNNLLPSEVTMHEKYDLKGSTYKRKASKSEYSKASPTLKDLDFLELHPNGLLLDRETHEALIKTLQRDCTVLESFKIMDFSLLVGIHNLDFNRERPENKLSISDGKNDASDDPQRQDSGHLVQRSKSVKRVQQYATALESILSNMEMVDFHDEDDVPIGGIPARNARGDRLYIFVGIIDVLQSYRFKKKLEHAMKALVAEGDTISVHRPRFYAERFQNFLSTKVFTKIPSSLRHSPSRRRLQKSRAVSQSESEERGRTRTLSAADRTYASRSISFCDDQGAVGGEDDLQIVDSTPPPTFAEATLDGINDFQTELKKDRKVQLVGADSDAPSVSHASDSTFMSSRVSQTQSYTSSSASDAMIDDIDVELDLTRILNNNQSPNLLSVIEEGSEYAHSQSDLGQQTTHM